MEMVRETYDNLAWVATETLALQRDPARVLEWVETEGADILCGLRNKAAILFTAHVGNWELMACWIAQFTADKLTVIVRESDDETERGLIATMRSRMGVTSISKRLPMTRVTSLLKRGECVGILPDQHGGKDGITLPYFGVETSTSPGPAVFAYLTGAPLVPISSRRIAPFRHKVLVEPPIEWHKLADRDETIRDITRKINESMERMVRAAPGQWLAQHRRFKELG